MKDPEIYQKWLAKQRAVKAPESLEDRVIQQIEVSSPASPEPILWGWARAALFIFAAVGGIGRYVILIFITLFN